MAKTHYKIAGVDCRKMGQTAFEYAHQTACGYVRDNVTTNDGHVNCKLCLKSPDMGHVQKTNSSFSDSQGCY